MSEEGKEFLTVSEIADKLGNSRAAVYKAIQTKRLDGTFNGFRWVIHKDQLAEYLKRRYSHAFTRDDGVLRIDPSKGELSLKGASKRVGCSMATIYRYAIMKKKIPFAKKGHTIVFKDQDIDAFKKWTKDNRCKFKT